MRTRLGLLAMAFSLLSFLVAYAAGLCFGCFGCLGSLVLLTEQLHKGSRVRLSHTHTTQVAVSLNLSHLTEDSGQTLTQCQTDVAHGCTVGPRLSPLIPRSFPLVWVYLQISRVWVRLSVQLQKQIHKSSKARTISWPKS